MEMCTVQRMELAKQTARAFLGDFAAYFPADAARRKTLWVTGPSTDSNKAEMP
jgi:hypothetical protein